MSNKRLAGVANLTINGITYDLVGDLVYSVNQFNNQMLIGQDGLHGYSSVPIPSHINAQIRDGGNVSILGLGQLTDTTVQSSLANGKQIVGNDMICVDVQEVATMTGVLSVRFEGPSVVEVFAS